MNDKKKKKRDSEKDTVTMQQQHQNAFEQNYFNQASFLARHHPQSQQQQQQQHPYHQQTQAQPINHPIKLAHPTSYHLEQTRLRNGNRQEPASNNDGAPPTPKNSFTHSTIDPGLLNNNLSSFPRPFFSHHHHHHHIKQESNSPDISNDLEFDPPSNLMSPLSNSPLGSPSHNSFDPDELIGTKLNIQAGGVHHVDTSSQFGESPGTQPSIYSPGPEQSDFLFEDFSTSAPSGPMDVKPINNTKFFNRPHGNNGFTNQIQPISMSLPVTLNQPTEWFGTSLDHTGGFAPGAHPSSLQFPHGELPIVNSEFLPEEGDTMEKRALMCEKRRRRRESHNAVERRRRDNINEKIQELSTLLPDSFNDSANKPNKGVILRKSVDYIRNLKQIVDQQDARNQELEAIVRELQSKIGSTNLDSSVSSSLETDDQSSNMNMMS
ncbi:hypothetical protein G9A89_017143 [Geosiphon pyriformis]|nr:hypothetical protein G9A89_017143 [Geosiphon pyriformis]